MNTMIQLIQKIKQISILLLVLSFVNCDKDEDKNEPQIAAGFTYTINVDTGTVTFINISENSDSYEWSFGDETDTTPATKSTEINPVHTFAGGTYTVILKASNVAGASNTFESIITFEIPEIFALPITFDNEKVTYSASTFNGAAFQIVDNPALGGTNNVASKVGEITNSGAAYEGIAFELGENLDLTTNKSVKINFWSDKAVDILLKLEISETDAVETTASHTGSGWEELTFNFNSSKSYPKVVVFVDGPGSSTGKFYIDDVIQVATEVVTPLCTTETLENIDPANGDLNWTFKTNDEDHTFGAFGNISSSIVANPLAEGINTSCSVDQYIKTAGCETWSGVGVELATALDFTSTSTNKVFKMKVLAENQLTDVTLRLERLPHPDVDPAIEVVASITEVGVWQELTFDFSGTSTGTYKSMIIYFDRNQPCDGDVYYFDDLMQVAGTGGTGGGTVTTCTDTMLSLPVDFDCDGIDYASKDTGDVAFEIIDNPELSGINASASKVAKLVFDSNQPWENMNLNLDTPISFATDKSIKLKLFSDSARTIKLKVETGGTAVENDQDHTGSGWEELTFTLATSESFSNLVLFVDGGANTVGTFYVDDIVQISSGGGSTGGGSTGGGSTDSFSLDKTIDFETAGFGGQWSWNVFENVDNPPLEFVANPNASGINTSSQVAKIIARKTGAPWVGTETVHGEMNLNWDLSASNAIIKIMVYKTVISDVGIKLVNPAGGAQGEIKVANTKINEWEELTFDFSSRIGNGLDGSTNIDQIVVFPDFTDSRTEETVTYFDNITFN